MCVRKSYAGIISLLCKTIHLDKGQTACLGLGTSTDITVVGALGSTQLLLLIHLTYTILCNGYETYCEQQ